MRHIYDFERAWVAGFLDGEGCFFGWSAERNGKTPVFMTKIEARQTGKRAPLDRVYDRLGGKVKEINAASITNRRVYLWHLTGGRAVKEALEILIPHLCGKKREAELLLEYVNTFSVHPMYGGGATSRLTPELISRRIHLIELMKRERKIG